jgi:hypothetical protein
VQPGPSQSIREQLHPLARPAPSIFFPSTLRTAVLSIMLTTPKSPAPLDSCTDIRSECGIKFTTAGTMTSSDMEFFDIEAFYRDNSPLDGNSTPSLDMSSESHSPEMSVREWSPNENGNEETLVSFANIEV